MVGLKHAQDGLHPTESSQHVREQQSELMVFCMGKAGPHPLLDLRSIIKTDQNSSL
jgi:hypothetical protein